MWHDSRRGRNIIKKRYSTRKIKLNIVSISVAIACLSVAIFAIFGIYKLSSNNSNENVVANNTEKEDNNIIIEKNSIIKIYDEETTEINKSFKLTFLGEMMMGGEIGENLNYNYMSAFKNITEYTSKSDYTVVNLGTNIIDLKEIKDSKSKYIVTKNILNAFNALGVDGINIANDHIMDFDTTILDETKSYIKDDYDLIGLKNTIIYAEHDGIKVAIIGVCNEVIGSQGTYTDAGIMMYNLKTLKSMIKEAKKNVNTVIMLTHLGLENTYMITNVMSWFYRELIDAGADIVLGDHALGIFPVEIYNEKPIIYSMGYLMSDTDYLIGKETGIFSLYVNEEGVIESIEIIPLYVNAKTQTILYSDYNKEASNKLIQTLVQQLDKKTYKISGDRLVITL